MHAPFCLSSEISLLPWHGTAHAGGKGRSLPSFHYSSSVRRSGNHTAWYQTVLIPGQPVEPMSCSLGEAFWSDFVSSSRPEDGLTVGAFHTHTSANVFKELSPPPCFLTLLWFNHIYTSLCLSRFSAFQSLKVWHFLYSQDNPEVLHHNTLYQDSGLV